jgi:hypothetical protein
MDSVLFQRLLFGFVVLVVAIMAFFGVDRESTIADQNKVIMDLTNQNVVLNNSLANVKEDLFLVNAELDLAENSLSGCKSKLVSLEFDLNFVRSVGINCFWAFDFYADYVGAVKHFGGSDYKDYYMNECWVLANSDWNKFVGVVK